MLWGFLMKAEKYTSRLSTESLEAREFCVNPANPITTTKKRKNKKMQKVFSSV